MVFVVAVMVLVFAKMVFAKSKADIVSCLKVLRSSAKIASTQTTKWGFPKVLINLMVHDRAGGGIQKRPKSNAFQEQRIDQLQTGWLQHLRLPDRQRREDKFQQTET